jgi:NAD(P)-dependent dehydrogenase (short-subunit alcohol dehydrogenase family)
MDLKLEGKKALVTGTGSQVGFGKGIALFLAQEGCDVICADIDLAGAQTTANEIKKLGRQTAALQVDITQKTSVDEAVKKAISAFGYLDILVNTAGRGSAMQPFTATSPSDWDNDININLRGTLHMVYAVIPHMLARKYGKIVNFSTHAADLPTGLPGAGVYVAAKAGVTMLSKTLAAEYGPEGINVNVIAPGAGNTNFHRVANPPGSPMVDEIAQKAKLGKTVTPEDIAWAVGFLVSDVSAKVVGQVIEVSPPMERRAKK